MLLALGAPPVPQLVGIGIEKQETPSAIKS